MASTEDEDEFLKRLDAIANPVPVSESAVRGAGMGMSGGWMSKLGAAVDTGVSKVPLVRDLAQQFHDPRFPPVNDPNVPLAQRLAAYDSANHAAAEANPNVFRGAEAGGAGLSMTALPAVRGMGALAGAGAAAGYDESETVGGKAKAMVKGGALGGATEAVAGSLGGMAETAEARNAALLRRELAGPQIGSTAEAAAVRKTVYQRGDEITKDVRKVPGLPEAIKSGDVRAQDAIASRVAQAASDETAEIYSHAAAKSREGGVPMSAVVDPLTDLAAKLRKSGNTVQAAEVDRLANDNVRVGMFGDGTVADPRAVRDFVSDQQALGKGKNNLTQDETQKVLASQKVAAVLKDSLNGWVRDNAGEAVAQRLDAANRRISAMKVVQDAATQAGYVQEMGAPKAPAGGFAGYAKALAAEAKKPTVRFADTPIGQSVLWSAAKSVKTLPAPLLDAWANKDPDAAKKAVADDLFGGSP